jgi:hypothetical protein
MGRFPFWDFSRIVHTTPQIETLSEQFCSLCGLGINRTKSKNSEISLASFLADRFFFADLGVLVTIDQFIAANQCTTK